MAENSYAPEIEDGKMEKVEINYPFEIGEMTKLTQSCVGNLIQIWTRTFDKDTCRNNLHRLYDHAKNFFDDLVNESIEKQAFIEDEIRTLRSEAEDLQRLLKINVDLSQILDDPNVPLLIVQKDLDKSLRDLREQLRRRREQICDLLLEQETLCDDLDEQPRPLLDDPLPTAEELNDFRNYLDSLKEERNKRTQDLIKIRREIKGLLKILELDVRTETDDRLLNHRQIQLSKKTFDDLSNMRDRFEDQVEELKNNIDNIRQKLPELWNRLKVPESDQCKIERNTEYNQTTYDILNMELERCENLKRQNLQYYIQKIRLEIEIWWDKTLKSDKERSRFTNFSNQIYTDELLTLHEMELDDLKQYFENNEQIFQLFNDRKILWERMLAIEQKACDPGRYNNRGGQLLKEEKERKTIATKLPKIEQQIKELVMEYQEREHKPFLVYGEDILEVMEAEWKKKREDKEALNSARKNAVTPQPNRSRANVTRTPLMQRTASTVTLCKTPSSTNISEFKRTATTAQKRKLNPTEKITPNAKRTLFALPTGVVGSSTKHNTAKAIKPANVRNKACRVIATTIRRRSGRLSVNGSVIKRRSFNKSGRNNGTNKIPKIIVTKNQSEDEENYDVFKNSIEPDSRSSTCHELLSTTTSQGVMKRQKQLSAIDEYRLANLPRPVLSKAPSKHNLRDFPISPGRAGPSSRKLTTKNLPIII